MAGKIVADPARMLTAAAQVESAAAEYRRLYTNLFNDVGAMKAAWQGADNVATTMQIEAFRPACQNMALEMDKYAEFLRAAANVLQGVQDGAISGAKRL